MNGDVRPADSLLASASWLHGSEVSAFFANRAKYYECKPADEDSGKDASNSSTATIMECVCEAALPSRCCNQWPSTAELHCFFGVQAGSARSRDYKCQGGKRRLEMARAHAKQAVLQSGVESTLRFAQPVGEVQHV